jgi:hypothetical protein
VNKELACIRCLMKEAEERQHLASKPPGTAKELPDDGQVHEHSLMDRPALHSSKTEVETLRVREFRQLAEVRRCALGRRGRDHAWTAMTEHVLGAVGVRGF